jgi:hypothetical protein
VPTETISWKMQFLKAARLFSPVTTMAGFPKGCCSDAWGSESGRLSRSVNVL